MSDDATRLPDPRMIPATQPQSWFEPAEASEPISDHDPVGGRSEASDADGVFVRPFIVTSGRTKPQHDGLKIETLVHARPDAESESLQFEQRRIAELAQNPVSVAEIAAVLRVPLGVARVLIADLYAGNVVSLHQPTELPVHVIERIRDLVRAL